MSDVEPLASTTASQLLADWDAGKTVRLYANRGPEAMSQSDATLILLAKVQMESLRIVLGFKPANTAKAKWNNLSGSTWTSHINQAVTAAGAQSLSALQQDTAANIGGQYFEQGPDAVLAGFTVQISKTAVVRP